MHFIEVTYGETSLFLEMAISVMSSFSDKLKYLQQRLCKPILLRETQFSALKIKVFMPMAQINLPLSIAINE